MNIINLRSIIQKSRKAYRIADKISAMILKGSRLAVKVLPLAMKLFSTQEKN